MGCSFHFVRKLLLLTNPIPIAHFIMCSGDFGLRDAFPLDASAQNGTPRESPPSRIIGKLLAPGR